jgi:hypothetical protein
MVNTLCVFVERQGKAVFILLSLMKEAKIIRLHNLLKISCTRKSSIQPAREDLRARTIDFLTQIL